MNTMIEKEEFLELCMENPDMTEEEIMLAYNGTELSARRTRSAWVETAAIGIFKIAGEVFHLLSCCKEALS